MTLTPDRDAFLRKLEQAVWDENAAAPSSAAIKTPNTVRFLKDAGLESTPVDPVSLKALQELLEDQDSKPAAASIPELTEEQIDLKQPPVQEVDAVRDLRHLASELSVPFSSTQSYNYYIERSNASTAGSTPVELTEGKRILQQLELQMALLMDLQRRMDVLTKVMMQEQLTSRGMPPTVMPPPPPGLPTGLAPGVPYPPPPPDARIPRQHLMIQQRVQPQAPPPRMMVAPLFEWVANLPQRISESRTAHAWRLFWALHQRHVRINGSLIFKVVLVVAIFSAKIMNRRKHQDADSMWTPTRKLYLVMSLVFGGFLLQSGYLQLFYRFFWKGDYLQRIYAGEDVDVNQIQWNAANQNDNERRPDNLRNRMLPRDNFLIGGNIPRPVQNGLNLVVDIFVLIGSFLLSLLPMWKPEDPHERQQRLNRVEEPPDLNQHAAEEEEQGEEDGHEHQD